MDTPLLYTMAKVAASDQSAAAAPTIVTASMIANDDDFDLRESRLIARTYGLDLGADDDDDPSFPDERGAGFKEGERKAILRGKCR